MIIQGQVGPITSTSSIASGTQSTARMGNMGELIASELHGRYYEAVYRRTVFMAANPSGVATVSYTSGNTTALLGVGVTNPIGSAVNLVLLKAGFSFPLINSTVNTVLLTAGYNASNAVTQTSPLTVRNSYVGLGAAGVGLAASSFTFPTAPNTVMHLGSMPAATTLPGSPTIIDLEGSIILPPGAYAAIITSAATPANGFLASMQWEEVPL